MTSTCYPCLEVNLSAIRNNAEVICDIYRKQNVSVAGVIKVSDGCPEIAKAYLDGGCVQIASSRIRHLAELKESFPDTESLLLRIPQISEARDVVEYADLSLNSETATLQALDRAAADAGKRHRVILMLDVGDRREGVTSIAELAEQASFVKKELKHLEVAGIGTNYGCISGVLPDDENLEMLCRAAGAVEAALGKPLEIVSGGGSSSLIRTCQGKLFPPGINHIRVGGVIANPVNMMINRGIRIPGIDIDTFCLQAQIVELKDKPAPTGSGKNWQGKDVDFGYDGVRRRAILAVGSQDIADPFNLLPIEEGIKVIGCSSDHTILDVSDYAGTLKVGDIVRFRLRYGAVLQIFSTRHVRKVFCA